MRRTHYCGALRREHMGQAAVCCGWVQTRRDMGGVIFLDVKDREGVLQVVCDGRRLPPEDFHRAETLRMQSVVQVEGLIAHRDEETYNPRLATGEVELRAERLTVLSEAQPLPFSLDEDAHVREELRLKYRYLDLRRPALQRDAALPPPGAVRRGALPGRGGLSARWKPPCSASPPPRAPGITWCPAGCIRAPSMPCPRARRSSSSC